MRRTEFLEKVWKPYPELSASHNVFGRVIRTHEKKLVLDDGRELQILREWEEILALGDVISAQVIDGHTKEICLLAPRLANYRLSKKKHEAILRWQAFLSEVRRFFLDRNFHEVNTPTLVSCPGTEVHLQPFVTTFQMGQSHKKFYLPTSPEIQLKKFLCMDFRQIFEMRPCFRNGELSPQHLPEFWMLEWYRAYADLGHIKTDLMDLIQHLRRAFGETTMVTFQTITISELFKKHFDFDLKVTTSIDDLKGLARRLDLKVEEYTDWDDVFHLIFVDRIERQLSSDQPLFVQKYPPTQAAYARLDNVGWADRFELYWKGFEIANAFNEVNDPQIQQQRMQRDLKQKAQLGLVEVGLDFDFFTALESGMPPSGGIALGLERLFMALFGYDSIQEIRPLQGAHGEE